MKKGLLIICISSSLISSSCVSYSTPTGLIKSPVVNASSSNYTDIKSIAEKFLPANSVLLSQNDLVSGKAVSTLDLDNDKSNEIIAFFKVQDKFEKGFIVLKKMNNNWSKIFEKKQECNSISKFDFINIVNKDTKSLLIGYFISGNSGAQYYSYTLKDGKVKEINLGWWKQFEILSTPSQNNKDFVFAGMSRGTGDVENWDVVRLNNEDICRDDDSYPSYAPKIIDYYSSILEQYKTKKSLGAMGGLAWYNLINAQVKGNLPETALKSIDNFNKLSSTDKSIFGIVDEDKFKLLQAKALNKLKRYSEAKSILDELQANLEQDLSSSSKNNNEKSLEAIKVAKLDLLNIYLEKGNIFQKLDQKDKFNELKVKALNLNLLNDYPKNEENGIIDLELNTAKAQLTKLRQ